MPAPRYKLWIDGVGCWNLVFGREWVIGGPGSNADMKMLAPLDDAAATLATKGESFELKQDGVTRRLPKEGTVEWSSGVSLRFRQPHPWTITATLQPTSSHRPIDQSDGLVLGAGSCVLGPESDCHVVCAKWPHGIVLFEREKVLYWKRFDGPHDANPVNRLASNSLIETDDVRVSVEVTTG